MAEKIYIVLPGIKATQEKPDATTTFGVVIIDNDAELIKVGLPVVPKKAVYQDKTTAFEDAKKLTQYLANCGSEYVDWTEAKGTLNIVLAAEQKLNTMKAFDAAELEAIIASALWRKAKDGDTSTPKTKSSDAPTPKTKGSDIIPTPRAKGGDAPTSKKKDDTSAPTPKAPKKKGLSPEEMLSAIEAAGGRVNGIIKSKVRKHMPLYDGEINVLKDLYEEFCS